MSYFKVVILNVVTLPIFFLGLTGCTSLTEEGSKVSISHTVWQGCRFVASVQGQETDSKSDFALRNKAGKLGANLVVVTEFANHGLIYGKIPSKGDAYKCVTELEKKTADEKIRLENEKKLAEEKARQDAERKLAEENAKLEEEKRLAEEKAKLEAEKKFLAEEKERLEKMKEDAENLAVKNNTKKNNILQEQSKVETQISEQTSSVSDENPTKTESTQEAQKPLDTVQKTATKESTSEKNLESAREPAQIKEPLSSENATLETQISKEKKKIPSKMQ